MRKWQALGLLPAFVLAACLPGRGGPLATPTPSVAAVTAAAAATPASVAPAAATATPAGSAYTVKPGDTLSSIAAANNTSIDAITKLNNLTDPNSLQVGQKLVLPPSSGSPSPAAGGAVSPAASSAESALASGSGPAPTPSPSRPPPP